MNLLLKTKPGANLLFGMPLFHVGGSLTQTLAALWPATALSSCRLRDGAIPRASRISGLSRTFQTRNGVERPDGAGGSVCRAARQCRHIERALRSRGRVGDFRRCWHGDPGQVWAQVLEVYGMTETSSVHTMAYPDRPIRLGSVGLPVPYARVRVVKLDADGRFERECALDEIAS